MGPSSSIPKTITLETISSNKTLDFKKKIIQKRRIVSYTVIKIRSSNLVSTEAYSPSTLWMVTNKHRKIWTNKPAMANLES